MAGADWEEVKRLAADFQKVQLSSTTQRLSERNCIEIINYITQKKLIDLVYTTDGKEYLTSAHLVSEIRSELYVNGGRVNLADLAKSIGVDLNHVTSHVGEVLKGHKDIHLVLGQLIDNLYIVRIAGEINEKLSQQGQININDLTIQYDLPADFLQQNVLEKHLGKLIFGKQDKTDPRVFFTESFVSRTKAKIRGAVSGLTRPTPVSAVCNYISISEKLFFSLFDQASMYGTLTSRMMGAQYVPTIYSRTQSEWVHNTYKQNHYLEFDQLNQLGISDCKTYLKNKLSNEPLTFLNSCVVSKTILERAEVEIEECIISKSFLDLQSCNLPSVLNEKDLKMILDIVLVGQKQKETVVIDSFIISKAFMDSLGKSCESLLQEKVKFVVESGKYQQYQTELLVSTSRPQKHEIEQEEVKQVDKREERRKKAAGGKMGGGTQGRETKTKSTKKNFRSKAAIEIDDYEQPEKKIALEVVSYEDIENAIRDTLDLEGLSEIIEPITNYLLKILNQSGLEAAAALYASTVTDRTSNRRQTHNDIQNKLNLMLGNIRLFEKGIKMFPADVQTQLYKHLFKTLCTDVINEFFIYISSESGSAVVDPGKFSNDQRSKYINDLPGEYRASLQNLLKTLSALNVDEFSSATEEALASCSMILKKIDKKKDRTSVLNYKYELLEQLNKCEDPALVLHLTAIIIFVTATQNMLHASGRHVASILAFLRQYLSEDQAGELTTYHDLVTVLLSGGEEAENAKEKLVETMPTIKMIANEYKKPNGGGERN